jgi:hypothetical protein
MLKFLNHLCSPAKLYLFITILGIIIALFNRIGLIPVFIKLLFALFWTFILNWLCKKGYKTLSWFIVLLPIILILIGCYQLKQYYVYLQM